MHNDRIAFLSSHAFPPETRTHYFSKNLFFLDKYVFLWLLRCARCLSSEMKRRANIFSTRSDSEDVFVARAATVLLLLRKQLSTETEGAGKEMAARKLKPLKTREKRKTPDRCWNHFPPSGGSGRRGGTSPDFEESPWLRDVKFSDPSLAWLAPASDVIMLAADAYAHSNVVGARFSLRVDI